MESCIPLPLDEKVLAEVADHARDWALLHGIYNVNLLN